MDSVGGGGGPAAESTAKLGEGVLLILGQWTALQMAVQHDWGGRDSRRKFDDLVCTILSFFSQSQDSLYIDDLENMLDESMVQDFNTEIEDGSVEEVAEQLMVMFEDCRHGNYESIEKLRKLSPPNAVSQSIKSSDENKSDGSEEEASDMMVDEPEPRETPIKNSIQMEVPDDGWTVVPCRRNKGKKEI